MREDLTFLAHDIRNIAASISLYADELKESPDPAHRIKGLKIRERIEKLVETCQSASAAGQLGRGN